MDDSQLELAIRLSLLPRVNVDDFVRLATLCSLQEFGGYSNTQLKQMGLTQKQVDVWCTSDAAVIRKCVDWKNKSADHHIISLADDRYPYLLKQVTNPPKLLFVKGQIDALHQPQIAIVGSRNASHEGLNWSYQFAKDLAYCDTVVTSGLALGIDGRAHRGALDALNGKTVAVLGSGLECIYPKQHIELSEQISRNGALVSEFFPWSPPKATFFPKRNRIISGLSVGVLVIEAAEKSGSLITARLALENNRDVFALPSGIGNPYTKGSNNLIKQGAYLVESVDDIMQHISLLSRCVEDHFVEDQQTQLLNQELPFSDLLANVGSEVRCVDFLAEISGQPVHEVMMQLLELELQGLVSAVPGGYIRTRRS